MKKHASFVLSGVLTLLPAAANARPYFRLMDPSHLNVGAGFLISPKDPASTIAITDLTLVTHSVEDGTIIPESWRSVFPPVAWTPLQVGFGGSLRGEAVIAVGTSANVAPSVAALLMRGVDGQSSGAAKAVKAALNGSGPGQVRLGASLACSATRGGVFQSAKQACPGQGLLDIVGNSARASVGFAWKF